MIRNITVDGEDALAMDTAEEIGPSGKTTLLNALIELLPDDERIVAIEDTLELRIDRPNCVRFEARGLPHGAVTIRDTAWRFFQNWRIFTSTTPRPGRPAPERRTPSA